MSSSPTRIAYPASALRSPVEEFVDALTHGIGLVLSLVGGVVLMDAALARGDLWCTLGCAIYAVTLVAVYAASTASHLYLPEHLNRLFRSLDQGFIYLLIVGTFTPFALTFLRSPAWLLLYGLLAAVAIGGFLSKTVFTHRLNGISVWLYVGLGWGQGVFVTPLLPCVPPAGFAWMAAGGLCYTVGVVFLLLDVRRYHFHSIWHLLVIAGSVCHYVAILQFVVGAA